MSPADEPIRLDYRVGPHPVASPWGTRALRLVLVCWASPLAVGALVAAVATFARLTGHRPPDLCVRVAVSDVMVNLLLTVAGYAAVLVFVAARWSAAVGDRWAAVVRPALAAVALLASNLCLTFGIGWSVANRR